MSRTLKLMSIPEIMEMAKGSVDFQGMRGELNWWTIFSGKVSHSHFDAIVDEIQANGFGMPIVLCDRFDDGNYLIGNGHHRLCAAILLGLWRIPVMVTVGADRDDYMCQDDSMDDWNRPMQGYSFDYWGMLKQNMESDYENYDEDEDCHDGGGFWCDECGTEFRISDHCCLQCHEEGMHVDKCGECDYRASECVCAYVTPGMVAENEWNYIRCIDCGQFGYALSHMHCAIDRHMDEAQDEDYGWQAERALLVSVGAAAEWAPGPKAQWHPEGVLDEAYAQEARWNADAPLRAARAAYEACVSNMREACKYGASEYVMLDHANAMVVAWNAYAAL